MDVGKIMFMNNTKFLKDTAAEASMSTMGIVIATAIGLLVLVAIFQVAPTLGNGIEEAVDIGYDVAATGALNATGETCDAETITIGTVTFELDTNENVTAGNVRVGNVSDGMPETTVAALTSAVGSNATTAALVTATNPTTTTMLLTSNDEGTDGNVVVTTETMEWGAFGAATLTGGLTDVSDWNSDDVPTGVSVWTENASLLLLVIIVSLLGLSIMVIRGLQ